MALFHYLSLRNSCAFFFICLASLRGTTTLAANEEDRKNYIVYMGALPKGQYSPSSQHMSILQGVVNSSYAGKSLIRSYTRSFNGFVAHLTEKEQQKLALHEDVVSIFPSRLLQLHTTESWDFMGFPQTVDRSLKSESDMIIGVLDTGIVPDSQSFSDEGFGPIPKKWKGVCKGGMDFKCNKKIIGARYYGLELSANDFKGHGTHTASIAAGNNVKDVSFFGLANGTARGGAPAARIAVYRVCTRAGCEEANIFAGFDDAIADGVDIISVSLGPVSAILNIAQDVIAVGSLHAAEKGILTVNSAGNNGSGPGLIPSTAPWLFTVGASSTSRKITNKVLLNHGASIDSRTINTYDLNGTYAPIVYGNDTRSTTQCDEDEAKRCHCMDTNLVMGKVVLCTNFIGLYEGLLKQALGYLMLMGEDQDDVSLMSPAGFSPLAFLNKQQFHQVESYYHSTKTPQVNILTSETLNDSTAPVMASFSSRGPNPVIPDILKPDITAPGIDILAAFNPQQSPSGHPVLDGRSVRYNILSGTSMSCPHVTGAAAYVKSKHPDWSSSAIKSALMTTAWRMDVKNTKHGDAEFSYGAGHLNPLKAINPGIVYETSAEDYVKVFCTLTNSSKVVKIFGDEKTTCNATSQMKPKDLNYPSMAAQVQKVGGFKVEFPRVVTNVGLPNSTYKATISTTASKLKISVVPNLLSFKALNEKKSFIVTISGESVDKNMISASLEWSDGIHTARSPIVIYA